MNTNKKVVSLIFLVTIFSFLGYNIIKNWDFISSFSWKFNPYEYPAILILILAVYPMNTFSWFFVSRAIGMRLKFPTSFKIWVLSNFARYMPGGVWQYFGRVYLAKKEGISLELATTSVVLEILFTLLAGGFVILITGFFGGLDTGYSLKTILLFVIFTTLFLVILTNNKFLNILTNWLSKFTSKREMLKKFRIKFYLIPLILLSFSMQFIIDGAILFFLSRQATDLSLLQLPAFVGIFTLSWILGYLTIIAPSGFGVQEVTQAILLSHYMPFSVASVIAILFRLFLIFGELLSLLLIYLCSYIFFKYPKEGRR